MTDSFLVRTMSRAEIDVAVEWAAAEGWNPGLAETARMYTGPAPAIDVRNPFGVTTFELG